jgi:hypothetical protein
VGHGRHGEHNHCYSGGAAVLRGEAVTFEEWWGKNAERLFGDWFEPIPYVKPICAAAWNAALDAAIHEVREGRASRTPSLNLPFLVDVAELERLKHS